MFAQARQVMVLAIIFAVLAFLPISATIINVPADYDTIQVAINASSDGDTVLVQPGTYIENINFNGHNIVLGSLFLTNGDTSFISQTIIDGDSSGSVVTFYFEEDSTTVISGFTITNGYNSHGGGIYCNSYSSPTISNNTITGNFALFGGGICCSQSSPTIINNTINENSVGSGGGIYCIESSPTISNNIISENYATIGGGIFCNVYSTPTITNNKITRNSAYDLGGGIYCNNSNSTISNNTITGNSANYGGGIFRLESSPAISNNLISENSVYEDGGGIYCYNSDLTVICNTIIENFADHEGGGICCWNSNPVIINTILWANIADSSGDEIYLDVSSSISISYSNVQDTLWPGEGNINTNPFFRDPDNGDFHLMATYCGDPYDSPCIDMGHPDSLDAYLDCQWGLGTERADMGAYGGDAEPQAEIRESETPKPKYFMLSQNYPNPFNASTTISFTIEHPQFVTLKVYDLLGREVRTLVDENRQAGLHNVAFDALDLSSGIYFYRLQAGDMAESKRMVLLK